MVEQCYEDRQEHIYPNHINFLHQNQPIVFAAAIKNKLRTRIRERERNGKLPYKTWMHHTTTQ